MAQKFNWSWKDYERCKRVEERKALKQRSDSAAKDAARAAVTNNEVEAQEIPTADDASGCKGRAAEVSSGPAPVEASEAPASHVAVKARQSRVFHRQKSKIDITRAPSSMEGAAVDWAAKAAPRVDRPMPAPARNQVLCRCGSREAKGSGFVPSWFGDKCIEGDCPLRRIAHRKAAA